MSGSVSAVVTLGFGSWGSIGLIVTLGFGTEAVTPPATGVVVCITGSDRSVVTLPSVNLDC